MAQDGKKPFVRYSFYKVDPRWRRLPEAQRDQGKAQFVAVVDEFSSQMEVNSYNLLGTRGDTDFMLWQLSPTLEALQELATGLYGTDLGKYISIPYSYLAMTRPSPYLGEHPHPSQAHRSGAIGPRGDAYLFVYPFVKTHDWYQLPKETRQEMMNEHFTISMEPTTQSIGGQRSMFPPRTYGGERHVLSPPHRKPPLQQPSGRIDSPAPTHRPAAPSRSTA